MTNEIPVGEAVTQACDHITPALVCGDSIGGFISLIVLITAILLILAICTTRKARILNPDVIFNPVIILRIVGFLLVVAGVASVCEMYDSVVFALFILAGDTDRNSKESVLLGIFQMPRLFLIALAVEAIVWTGLSLIVNTVGRKKTMTGQHTGARDGGTTAHDP